jgi:prepilin-type N-terminal cleavage/methylation domain-containing protein
MKRNVLEAKDNPGLTLPEVLVAITILVVLMTMAVPVFTSFREDSDLNNNAEEIINVLRIAQSKTLSGEEASRWGVYFDTSTSPHQYVLFRGDDYQRRVVSSDQVHKLPSNLEIYQTDLWGKEELVFQRITGSVTTTEQSGSVSLRSKKTPTKNRTIYIMNFGQVGLQ